MRSSFFAAVAVLGMFGSADAMAEEYQIDGSHTVAGFKVRHMMVSWTKGQFEKVSGTVQWDPKAPKKTVVDVAIDMASLDTGNDKRDSHLKSPDFFDVDSFPQMAFRSKKVKNLSDDGSFDLVGDLTLHGVTKEVTLSVDAPTDEVKDPWGSVRIGTSAKTMVNRQDFGVAWNKVLDTGGVVVGDDVQIEIDVEFYRSAEPATAEAAE